MCQHVGRVHAPDASSTVETLKNTLLRAFRAMVGQYKPNGPPLQDSPAASLGEKTQTIYVAGGDMNLIWQNFLVGVSRCLTDFMKEVTGQLHYVSHNRSKLTYPTKARNWIVANACLEEVPCEPPGPRLSRNKAHAVLIARWSRKSCEVPMTALPRKGVVLTVLRDRKRKMRSSIVARTSGIEAASATS